MRIRDHLPGFVTLLELKFTKAILLFIAAYISAGIGATVAGCGAAALLTPQLIIMLMFTWIACWREILVLAAVALLLETDNGFSQVLNRSNVALPLKVAFLLVAGYVAFLAAYSPDMQPGRCYL